MKYRICAGCCPLGAPETWLSKNAKSESDRLRRAVLGDGHTSACFDQIVIIAHGAVGVCDGCHREEVMKKVDALSFAGSPWK